MIVSKTITSMIAKMGAVLLLIRSVRGSAFPIPPQEPHISPNWFLLRQIGNSFSFAQRSHELLLIPLEQVPVPEQCLQS